MSVFIEQALRQILIDNAAVAAVVSTRVFPHDVPQGESMPAIVYTLDDSRPIAHLTGRGGVVADFDLLCLAEGYGTAKDLAEKTRAALAHYSGEVTPAGADQITISKVLHQSTDDVELSPLDGSGIPPKAVSVTVRIYYAA
tara:strand:+ start:1565 stop:1987 length:423 start_codon:yes stop_codon:yes gene_type:complete